MHKSNFMLSSRLPVKKRSETCRKLPNPDKCGVSAALPRPTGRSPALPDAAAQDACRGWIRAFEEHQHEVRFAFVRVLNATQPRGALQLQPQGEIMEPLD